MRLPVFGKSHFTVATPSTARGEQIASTTSLVSSRTEGLDLIGLNEPGDQSNLFLVSAIQIPAAE